MNTLDSHFTTVLGADSLQLPPAKPIVVAVTGCSGYLGQAVVRALEADSRVAKIVGVDRRPPRKNAATEGESRKLTFFQQDVTSAGLETLLVNEGVTHLAHLAFFLDPIHDRRLVRRINVEGSERVLVAAGTARVQSLVFASSSVVYGARRDHPPQIREDHRLSPARQVQYTLDKVEVESLCRRFAGENPKTAVNILRLVTIVGPAMRNFLSRTLDKPCVPLPIGHDPPWQFIHEDDAARAVVAALFAGTSSTYNVAADGTLPFSEVAKLAGVRTLRLPRQLLKLSADLCWNLRLHKLSEIPGALVDYMAFPPTLDNTQIKDKLRVQFAYDSREALITYLDSRDGVEKQTGAPVEQASVSSGS